MALYRLVQESVNNALDHASATRIDVRLCWLDHEITLEVRDDGIGFEPAVYLASLRHTNGATHFGLLNLRERVIALNGDLTIDSQPGRGATVRARLPLSSTN
jgi:signal transduction histidine kinase